MLEGSAVEGVLSGVWNGLLASDGVILLLLGIAIGFLLSIGLGILAQSKTTREEKESKESTEENVVGSLSQSQGICL